MQDWPAYENAAEAVRRAASSRSASEWTTTAAFPPISRATRFLGTRAFNRHPTAPEPVKDTIGRRGSRTSASASAPGIGRTEYCLLYTSDAADEEDSVDLGGRRIIK